MINDYFDSLKCQIDVVTNEKLKDLEEKTIISDENLTIQYQVSSRDVFNEIRDAIINELERQQKETIQYYETIKYDLERANKIKLKNLEAAQKVEYLERKIFANKSIVLIKRPTQLLIFDIYLNSTQRRNFS